MKNARVYGTAGTVPLVWVLAGLESGGFLPGGPSPFIFSPTASKSNIVANRATGEITTSPTAVGLFVAGSDSVGGAPGALGDYATIGGGDLAGVGGATATYSTVVGGYGGLASGVGSTVLGGQSNQAPGIDAIAGGYTSKATGAGAVALGYQVTAAGDHSFASGYMSFANGVNSFAANSGVANGQWSVALGTGTTGVNGAYALAEGFNTQANFNSDHAEGFETVATSVSAGAAHAQGYATQALADGCASAGVFALGTRTGESVHASGQVARLGDAQTGKIVLFGLSTGAPVPLQYGVSGTETFTLTNTNGQGVNTINFTIAAKAATANTPGILDFWGLSGTIVASWDGGVGPINFPAGAPSFAATPGTDSSSGASGWEVAFADGGNGQLIATFFQLGPSTITTVKVAVTLTYGQAGYV